MEACRGDSGVVLDSALTDDTGSYRVGNLKPGNTYLMRVRLDGRVISAHPTGHKVSVSLSVGICCWHAHAKSLAVHASCACATVLECNSCRAVKPTSKPTCLC